MTEIYANTPDVAQQTDVMSYLRATHPTVAAQIQTLWGTVELDEYLNTMLLLDENSPPDIFPAKDGPLLLRVAVKNWYTMIEKGVIEMYSGHSFDPNHVVVDPDAVEDDKAKGKVKK